ncbi:Ger(x)C family spore germination protein [Halobacillus shinanisalinarum]|uniref:Ger(X)C family spore germination protein n=1 Tax=Halobacillus shinanisalinarum TaxID=2932258 RepID=A0ABY4GXL1_9BACI|nr:Ger(x)C family spore germination protein [Halobacillus shinanisalinarum]UOQ92921.1 Ger(x)C family spore germination protein [Halobacillus shinanisalinarum]
MGKKSIYLFLSCLSLVLLTGCWDQVQIERRGFVIGTAIDLSESGDLSTQTKRDSSFALTYQFVAPGEIGVKSQGQGGQQKPFFNVTAHGSNIFDITRGMATKTSRTPYLGHLQLIVISSEVAKKPHAFANILDVFLRDHEMRRTVKVLVASDKAKNVLDFKSTTEKLPAVHIDSVTENAHKNVAIAPPLQIGDVHEYLLVERSIAIPVISMSKQNKPKIERAAVYHGSSHKMVDVLSEEETRGLNLIKGQVEGGAITVNVQDSSVVYEIRRAKAKIKAKVKGKDDIQFTITIETEGKIAESFANIDYTDPTNISMVEKKVEEELNRLANVSIEKMHKDLQVDAFDFGRYIKRSDYDLWQSIKGDWDAGENYFAKSTITVQTDAVIRSEGSVIETER